MIERWRKFLDIGHTGARLTEHSKTFDCIDHELLIAKLYAYGFDFDVLKFICSYLRGENRGLRLIPHVVPLLKCCSIFKDQFLGHYY